MIRKLGKSGNPLPSSPEYKIGFRAGTLWLRRKLFRSYIGGILTSLAVWVIYELVK